MSSSNIFKETISEIRSISGCYQNGLSALGADSKYVTASDTRKIDGSVDLDKAMKKSHPQASRWDYIIGYNGQLEFIEIHPASSFDKLTEVIAKANWLRQWMNSEGQKLKSLHKSGCFYWIPTSKVVFISSSRQWKMMAINKINLKSPPLKLQ